MNTYHRTGLSLALGALVSAAALVGGCDNDASTSSKPAGGSSTPPSVGHGATTRDASAPGDATGITAAPGAGGATVAAAKEATATIEPSKAPGQDNVAGTVRFTPAGNGLKVHAEITGLEPNSKHGFHIHDKADLSAPDLMSAGGHFNPGGHKHGGPTGAERHGGDLGNIEADATGKATYDVTVQGITIDDPTTGVVGKSVIVHATADDLKTDPSGSSGARIAGGVIKAGGK